MRTNDRPSVLRRLASATLWMALGFALGLSAFVAREFAGVGPQRAAKVVTPASRPCPDPLSHTGPFDPRTGEPRAGGYRTVEQIDAGNR